MRKELILALFAGLIFLQISVPVTMIVKREIALRYGTTFKFKTAPVDPYDAFRGRYVALSVDTNNVAKPAGVDLKNGQKVFAQLSVDERGFAQVSKISTQKPQGGAYLMAKVTYLSGKYVGINLPIDRYYMEETAAPRAERIYRERSSRDNPDAHVLVRVLNGFLVIEGLYIGDQKIEDIIKQKS